MVTKWVFVLLLALVVFASGDAQSTPVAGTLTESTSSNVDHAVRTGRGNKLMYQANVGTDGDDGEERGMAEVAAKIEVFFRSKMTVIVEFFQRLWKLAKDPYRKWKVKKIRRLIKSGASDEELMEAGCDPKIVFDALRLPLRLKGIGNKIPDSFLTNQPKLRRYVAFRALHKSVMKRRHAEKMIASTKAA